MLVVLTILIVLNKIKMEVKHACYYSKVTIKSSSVFIGILAILKLRSGRVVDDTNLKCSNLLPSHHCGFETSSGNILLVGV